MQFVANGPDVPEELLQAHEDGKVVFFCSAGISYPAELPSFRDLVTRIYAEIGEIPNPIEELALASKSYDTTIALWKIKSCLCQGALIPRQANSASSE